MINYVSPMILSITPLIFNNCKYWEFFDKLLSFTNHFSLIISTYPTVQNFIRKPRTLLSVNFEVLISTLTDTF